SCAGANTCLNALPTLTGTAADPLNPNPPSILQSGVKISVKRNSDGFYWDPVSSSFVGGLTEFAPGGFSQAGSPPTYSWSTGTLTGLSNALQDGIDYTVAAHAADLAGNDLTAAQYTFVYDTSTPTAYMTAPST